MVALVNAQEDIDTFTTLVREYTDGIIRQNPAAAETLESQHLEDELKNIGKKYGRPDGRTYILLVDGKQQDALPCRGSMAGAAS